MVGGAEVVGGVVVGGVVTTGEGGVVTVGVVAVGTVTFTDGAAGGIAGMPAGEGATVVSGAVDRTAAGPGDVLDGEDVPPEPVGARPAATGGAGASGVVVAGAPSGSAAS